MVTEFERYCTVNANHDGENKPASRWDHFKWDEPFKKTFHSLAQWIYDVLRYIVWTDERSLSNLFNVIASEGFRKPVDFTKDIYPGHIFLHHAQLLIRYLSQYELGLQQSRVGRALDSK
ncbi:MAG: hypothetical protein KDH94_08420 [Coxiellaceae bacterium]|nr:hypothetical protein [Coxiellaceae bacterium]